MSLIENHFPLNINLLWVNSKNINYVGNSIKSDQFGNWAREEKISMSISETHDCCG